MIDFNFVTEFVLHDRENMSRWISGIIKQEDFIVGDINFIFCDDEYLLEKNVKYLKHNTLTDVLTFDYSFDNTIAGDIFISTERVEENAKMYSVSMDDELHRVMAHGILHLCGYKDKRKPEKDIMRSKEDYYLSLRTF